MKHIEENTSLLFVCLGNICRSPAAEGIMRQLVERRGLEDRITIDSAGVSGWHAGELPDRRMRSHGADHGYDFNSRSRQFTTDDFRRFDYILVMDDENMADITAMARNEDERNSVMMLTDFLRRHNGYATVPDPYYGGDHGFELVIELLEDACEGLLNHIIRQHRLDDYL